MLEALESANRAITVAPSEHPVPWTFRMTSDDGLDPVLDWDAVATRRQDVEPTCRLNGAVYALRADVVRCGDSLSGPGTKMVVMPPESSIDIDGRLDREIARFLPARATPAVDR